MKSILISIFASIFIFTFSCDLPQHYFVERPPCHSETVDDLKSDKQRLLLNKLKSKTPNDYRYFFKTFEEDGNNTFMITNFRNDESCFDIRMLVDIWDKLAGMKRTNGYAYPKELFDLKWELKSIEGEAVIKYIDMHKIID